MILSSNFTAFTLFLIQSGKNMNTINKLSQAMQWRIWIPTFMWTFKPGILISFVSLLFKSSKNFLTTSNKRKEIIVISFTTSIGKRFSTFLYSRTPSIKIKPCLPLRVFFTNKNCSKPHKTWISRTSWDFSRNPRGTRTRGWEPLL